MLVHDDLNVAAIAVGDRTFTLAVDSGSASSSASAYADGFLMFADGTAQGTIYGVKSSTGSSSSTMTVTIHDPAGVRTASALGGSDLEVYPSPYNALVVSPVDAQQGAVCVANRLITASYYFWGQVRGCCALTVAMQGAGGDEFDEKIIIADKATAGRGLIVGAPATSSTCYLQPMLAKLVQEGDVTSGEAVLVQLLL